MTLPGPITFWEVRPGGSLGLQGHERLDGHAVLGVALGRGAARDHADHVVEDGGAERPGDRGARTQVGDEDPRAEVRRDRVAPGGVGPADLIVGGVFDADPSP